MISDGLSDIDDVRSAAIDTVEVLLEASEEKKSQAKGKPGREKEEEEEEEEDHSKLADLLWLCIEESDELSVSSAPALRILAKLERGEEEERGRREEKGGGGRRKEEGGGGRRREEGEGRRRQEEEGEGRRRE
eukprot:754578-Hanusia_phi.AAC.2